MACRLTQAVWRAALAGSYHDRTQTEYPQKLPGAWAMGGMLGVCIRALPVRGLRGSGRSIGPSNGREVEEVVTNRSKLPLEVYALIALVFFGTFPLQELLVALQVPFCSRNWRKRLGETTNLQRVIVARVMPSEVV